MVAHAQARDARVLLTGLWSDQLLFELGYLTDLFLRLAWRTVARHLDEYPRWFVGADRALSPIAISPRAGLLSGAAMRCAMWHAPCARAGLSRGIRRSSSVTGRSASSGGAAASRIRASGRPTHGACMTPCARSGAGCSFEVDEKLIASYGMETATPFLDRTVISFLMSIPGEVQDGGGVPRLILREAMRGIVPDPILGRRWGDEESRGSAGDSARLGLESWRRCFFMEQALSGKLTMPPRPCL